MGYFFGVPYFRKQPQENSKTLGAFGLPGWPTRIPRPGLFFVEAFRVLGFAVLGVLGCWVSGIWGVVWGFRGFSGFRV